MLCICKDKSNNFIYKTYKQDLPGVSINNLLIRRCTSPSQGVRNVALLGGIVHKLCG